MIYIILLEILSRLIICENSDHYIVPQFSNIPIILIAYRCRLSSRRMLLRVRIKRKAPLPREVLRFSPLFKVGNHWSGCNPLCMLSSISVAPWITLSKAYAEIVLPIYVLHDLAEFSIGIVRTFVRTKKTIRSICRSCSLQDSV